MLLLFKVKRSHEVFFTKLRSMVFAANTDAVRMSMKKHTTILFVLWKDLKMNLKMKKKKVQDTQSLSSFNEKI